MNAIIYLLQVSACTAAFYGLYYFLLSRLTFFTINKWYLMATLALSFMIPVLTIHVNAGYLPGIQAGLQVSQFKTPPTQQQVIDVHTAVAAPAINWLAILKGIYLAGAAALLIRLVVALSAFFATVRGMHSTSVGHVRIIHGNKKINNGSFLNYIFLNDDELNADETRQIIQHELLHVKQLHSVDRIILNMIQIILWFNPFIYLYGRAVEENHEFEVDRAIGLSTDKNKYAGLLLHLSVANQGVLYNNFSKAPLERRITMLFNQPTQNMKKITYALVLPLAAVSCLAFANLEPVKNGSPVHQSGLPAAVDTSNGRPQLINNQKQTAGDHLATIGFDQQTSSSSFYSRVHIQNADGKRFDKVTFKLADGAASANLGTDDKVGVFIDGVFYEEDALKKLPAQKTASLSFDNSKSGFKPKEIPNGNYAVPFSFKTKSSKGAPYSPEFK